MSALSRGGLNTADTAGLLSFTVGLFGTAAGIVSTMLTVRGLRAQRTVEVITAELARAVLRSEGAQYRQLLGSGRKAPDGRIDLPFVTTASGVSGARPDGTLENITVYYRSLRPGRLVITGTPTTGTRGTAGAGDAGAGKTVLALALLLGLAKERGPGEPVPVRLTAASWPGAGIRPWLSAHLADVFGLSRRDADQVVDADLVLPVIDGLDEMDSGATPGYTSHAARLLRAIEEFESGGEPRPVVVTCRHAHYQALVEADAQPKAMARIALARIDAARARTYLIQRVAGTEVGRARWRPVLDALEEATTAEAAADSSQALARALDTPWRLTLAATVFQERTPSGAYLRDPADLLTFAAGGRLYGYLMDRYIGAAVSAPHHAADNTRPGAPVEARRLPKLDADTTWRRLAVLARYLHTNSGTASEPPRIVAGRALSSTDLALHELWPIAGHRRVRWTDRTLAVLGLNTALAAVLSRLSGFPHTSLVAFLPLAVLAWGQAWPQPRHMDIHSLHTRVGRRKLTAWLVAGLALGLSVAITGGLMLGFLFGPVLDLAIGTVMGLVLGLAAGLVAKDESSTSPRALLRGDISTWLVFGLTGGLVGGLMGWFVNEAFASGGRRVLGPEIGFVAGLTLGLVCGLLVGYLTGVGQAATRYFAFLLHVRGRLPWRLGRFLDDCYQLGILRVADTAWQFRHRELQDHLATRPAPPLGR
ncbi:hypothetical protein ACFVJH_27925 [Streptomyces decoyicus]|uniref:hypothetical protein n=1 Tax=Streptomyces decoyicus TaxID=249567 RepID=UPI0036386619